MAAIGVSLRDTGTATVAIGTVADDDWSRNVTVRDGNGDGTVTLRLQPTSVVGSDAPALGRSARRRR